MLFIDYTEAIYTGFTQNYEKTNHKGHKEHEVKRVGESSCVSPNIYLYFSLIARKLMSYGYSFYR
jgi:hypothetical protein